MHVLCDWVVGAVQISDLLVDSYNTPDKKMPGVPKNNNTVQTMQMFLIYLCLSAWVDASMLGNEEDYNAMFYAFIISS